MPQWGQSIFWKKHKMESLINEHALLTFYKTKKPRLTIFCVINEKSSYKDLFIKIRTRTVVKLLLFWFEFLWISLYQQVQKVFPGFTEKLYLQFWVYSDYQSKIRSKQITELNKLLGFIALGLGVLHLMKKTFGFNVKRFVQFAETTYVLDSCDYIVT